MPDSKIKLIIDIDLINNSKEILMLDQAQLVRFEVTGELVQGIFQYCRFSDPRRANKTVLFPVELGPESRSVVRTTVGLVLTHTSTEAFVPARLNDPGTYTLAFSMVFEDMKRVSRERVVPVGEDFTSIRDTVVDFWRRKGFTDMLVALEE